MMPPDYIHNQLDMNLRHKDGSIEGPTEDGILAAKWLIKWIQLANLPCTSLLDAGCRTGYALDTFSEAFPDCVLAGIDVVPDFIKYGQDRGRKGLQVADIHNLPFEDEEFDWVFCTGTIEHCYDERLAASELARVAHCGLYVSAETQDAADFEANPSHYCRHQDPFEWLQIFRQPNWYLVHAVMPTRGYLNMIWLSQDYFDNFGRKPRAVRG